MSERTLTIHILKDGALRVVNMDELTLTEWDVGSWQVSDHRSQRVFSSLFTPDGPASQERPWAA